MLSDNSGRQGWPLKIVCLLMNQYIRLLRCGYVKYRVTAQQRSADYDIKNTPSFCHSQIQHFISDSDSDLFIRHYNKQKYNLFNMNDDLSGDPY